MAHAETKQVNGSYEFFDDHGTQITLQGEQIANIDPDYPVSQLFVDFYDTELGDDFLEIYGLDTVNPKTGKTNAQVIERIFLKLYAHDPRMTMSRIADTVQTAISSGELTSIPEEASAPVARDEAGRFQNQLINEYHRMLADTSLPANAISQRMRTDRLFREAVESEGKVKPAPLTEDQQDVTGELQSFVDSWRRCPNLRPIGGFVQLDEHTRLSISELNNWINRASAAGLI